MKEKIIFSSLFLSALILNLVPAADGTFTQKIILSSPDQMIVNSEEEPSFIQNNPIPSSTSNDDVSFEPGTVIELAPDDDAAYYPSTDGYDDYYYGEDEDVQYDDGSNNGASTTVGGSVGGGSGTITIGDPSSGGFSFGFVTQQPQQGGSRGNSYSNSQSSSHSATDSSMQAAQNSFMATPLSEQYQEAVYEAFAAVRQNCKADYENICAATPAPFSEFSLPLLNFFGNTLLSSFISRSGFFESSSRRLLDVATLPFNHPISFFKKADIHSKLDAMASKFAAFRNDFKSAAGDSVKSNSNAPESISTSVSDKKSADVKERAFPLSHLHLLNGGFNFGPVSKVTQSQLRGNVRKLDDYNTRKRAADIPSFPLLNSKFFGGPMPPPPSFPAPPAVSNPGRAGPGMSQPPQRFPGGPPMPPPPDAVPGRPCHNDHDHDHHDRDHPPSPPPPPENQDNVFKGELLYGVDGDDCMYLNFDSLSDSCQQSIANVYALREEYWSDETANTHPHGPFVAILFSIFLITIFIAIKRSRFNKLRRAKDLAIYNALQANPDLKAQLEAASGVVVEAPPARKSCICIFLRVTGFMILGFVLWAVTTMITITSVHHMVYVDENGNEVYPNPLIPLIIFLVTLTSLILVSATIIRSMRRSMCPRYNQSSNNNNNNNNSTSSNTSGVNRFAISNYFRLPAPTFWSTSTGTTDNNSYYVPLNDDSTHPAASIGGSREMVIIQQNQQQMATNYPNNQPRTVVLSNYPPITQCVTPVNII